MHDPRGSSLGKILGMLAVVIGILYLGLGLASVVGGHGLDGGDGLLFGGLAFAAGCAILWRRERTAPSEQPVSEEVGHDPESSGDESS